MRMRGDMNCFHEPFGEAWYQGEDARAPRIHDQSPRKPGLSFASVQQKLQDAAGIRPVFSKDMPQFTDHLWSDEFLNQYLHSFLIRDPAKVLASLQRSWERKGDTEGFTRNEIGFDEQRRLFDILYAKSGTVPVVVDSDDLLEDPPGMVSAWCDAVGIPYIESALSWEPGSRSEVLWYDGDDSIWHESLKNSDGLKPQPHRPANPDELPPRLKDFYHDFLAHYRHLHGVRLRVSES